MLRWPWEAAELGRRTLCAHAHPTQGVPSLAGMAKSLSVI